ARADRARVGAAHVDLDAELLQLERALGAAHRIAIDARAVRVGAPEPLAVADEDAPRLAVPDRVDARAVRARRLPLEQRRIERRALIDLRLVGRGGLALLTDEAVDEPPVAID